MQLSGTNRSDKQIQHTYRAKTAAPKATEVGKDRHTVSLRHRSSGKLRQREKLK